jgi:hypothetical protein
MSEYAQGFAAYGIDVSVLRPDQDLNDHVTYLPVPFERQQR